jgi:hypothetical protein
LSSAALGWEVDPDPDEDGTMAKRVRFDPATAFNFGANVAPKPRKRKSVGKPRKGSRGSKGGGS